MAKKYKIGYTTGVFDLFHIGHLNILQSAKECCDYLIVGVSTDELVSYKNSKAVIPFSERMEIVRSIRYVDQVVSQESMDKFNAWEKYKFDAMFVGSDWQGSEKWKDYEAQFKAIGVDIVYFPYTKHTSSTELRAALNRILEKHSLKEALVSKNKVPLENDFIEKFQLRKLLIKQIGNWNISVRPQQPTIGSLILSLNRRCESLSQLNTEEGEQISLAFVEIEKMLKNAFAPSLINYLALMLVDHQVHFHVIPRYSNEVVFKNVKYSDKDWPHIHSLKALDIDENTLVDILEYLKLNTN